MAKDYNGSLLPLEKFIKEIFYKEAVLLTNEICKEEALDLSLGDPTKKPWILEGLRPRKREFVMGES